MASVLRFTLIMGPLSSLFDIATFSVLRLWLVAPAELFQTGWFLESLFTQFLVIFIIRTVRPAWSSPAHPALVISTLGALLVGLTLVLTPFERIFGFVALPPSVAGAMVAMSLAYLAAAEVAKPFAFAEGRGRLQRFVVHLIAPATTPAKMHRAIPDAGRPFRAP
jgi:Mg2+-importing ATPase